MREFSLMRVWFLLIALVTITLTIMSIQQPIYGYGLMNPDPMNQVLIDEVIKVMQDDHDAESSTLINNPPIKKIYITHYYIDVEMDTIVFVDYKGRMYIEPASGVVLTSDGYIAVTLDGRVIYEVDSWYRRKAFCEELCMLVDDEAMTHEEFAEEYMPEQPNYDQEVQNPELFIDPYYEEEPDIRSIQDNSPGIMFPDDRLRDSDEFSCTKSVCDGTYTREETSFG